MQVSETQEVRSEKQELVKELINKIQANHSELSIYESDKFRMIFDHTIKNNYIIHEEIIWLQQIAERFN
ncbi:MAG: hypothetical protein M5U17_01890 [Ignavibacterium sp.]|nr:hypothetical protein [Ignavibacterium sp.]